jgi:dienelactone hydrolase
MTDPAASQHSPGSGTRASHGRRKWVRRTLITLLVLALVVVITAGGYLGYVGFRRAQSVTLPAPTGSYPVGRTLFDWTDHSRTDPLAPRPGLPRQLSVWLWYPATREAPSHPAPYTPGNWEQLHLTGLAGLGESSFDAVHDHSLDAVGVAAGRFPVVVLEPGLGLSAPQYTTLAENLASHGYLVAGVTPTYSANLTVIHGQVVHSTPAGNPQQVFNSPNPDNAQVAAVGDRLVAVWVNDAHFTATQVAALDRTGPLSGHVDATRTAYIGHSFGGAASLEACRTDAHCAAAADLDGAQFGPVVRTGLSKPMMIIASQGSCVIGTCDATNTSQRANLATARALLAASTGPTWCYQIDGTLHFNFTDDAAYYLAAPVRHLVPLGTIDGDLGLTITNSYLTAFLDHTVKSEPQPLLTGRSTPYPQVRAERTPR